MSILRRDLEDLERFGEILEIIVREECGYILDRLHITDRLPMARRLMARHQERPGPERLRETIEELGTTFIKFGQLMSERPDVVPDRYVEELRNLQDSTEGFGGETAEKIVEEEIGLEEFESFEEEYIAAASIAQVHEARLNSGEEVVVKVRRPGIVEEVQKDLDILGFLVKRAEKHVESLRKVEATKIFREFEKWTKDELDLTKEMRNAQIFKENLEEEDYLKVPEVYPEYSSEKVLVMEKVDGVKCTEDEKLGEMDVDSEELAKKAIRSTLKQMVIDGFFHADPHPSNFLIDEEGRMIYLDFGMMGQIPKRLRDKIDLLLIHGVRENSQQFFDIMKDIGRVSDDANEEAIKEKIDRNLMMLSNSSVSEDTISEELMELIVFSGKNGIVLPTSITMVAKNLVTMEGIGMTLCPHYDPTDTYEEYGEEVLKEANKPQDMAKDAALDVIQNKDAITRPLTFARENMGRGDDQESRPVKESVDPMPSVLVISAAAILVAGAVLDRTMMYASIVPALAGLYMHHS